MRLVADSGLWRIGPHDTAAPTLTAVLEVSGAVLSWTVDEPPGDGSALITFTDVARADWLWRVLGESAHVALTSAVGAADPVSDQPAGIELTGVDFVPGSIDPLRKLAMGHWLRRWWPASQRDGIAGLDRALLDVEVALLTGDAEGFFTDDTLDSDVVRAAGTARHGLDHARPKRRRADSGPGPGRCRAGRRGRTGWRRMAGITVRS